MNPFENIILLKVLLIILLVAAAIDLHTYKIPNLITIPAIFAALVFHAGQQGFSGLFFCLAGLGVGLLLLLLPYLMGGLGGGDVKLMGVVGAFLGAKAVVGAFLFTAVIGGLYALSIILLHPPHFHGFFTNQRAAFYELLLTRKITLGSNTLSLDRPCLKYGLAIMLGTGLYIVAKTNGFTFI